MNKVSVGSLYAGIGGIDKAFINAGADIFWANEYDKHACMTYRANFSHKLYDEDVYKLDPRNLRVVDILVAGFPCQSFSVAGYRKGFKDERGNHFFRIMEFATILKPKILFLENVKNLLGHDHGKTWNIIYNTLKDSNYEVRYKVLNTMHYGNLPQTRERFYAVCFRKNGTGTDPYSEHFYFPNTLPLKTKIRELLNDNKVDPKYYYGKEKYMYKHLAESMKRSDTIYQWRRIYVRENKSNVCPTLTANMGTGGHNVPLVKTSYGFRKLTPIECFRFQGFNDIILPDEIPMTQQYKQAGNSVSVRVVERIAVNIINSIKESSQNLNLKANNKTSLVANK